jgi:DNA-binding CsgD family transcriptional regulator
VRYRYDFALAERLARAAISAGAGFRARLLAAELVGFQGRGDQADAELEALAGEAKDDDERGLVAVARLTLLALDLGELTKAMAVAEEAQLVVNDPARRDEISAVRAGLLVAVKTYGAAAAECEPLLERATGRAEVWACIFAAMSFGRQGRLSAAIRATERGHAAQLAYTEPLTGHPWAHLLHRCHTMNFAGRFADADALARAQYEQGVQERSPEAQAMFAWALARSVAERGHVQSAIRYAREAVALCRQLGRTQAVRGCLTHLGLALALGGHPQEAERALTDPDAPDFDTPLYTARVDVLQAWAWTASAAGNLPRAREYLADAVELAQRIEDAVGLTSALHGLARLGYSRQVLSQLETAAGMVEGVLAPARATHAGGLARRDPTRLLAVSADFQRMGATLLAAEAAADAGVAWRQRGDSRASAAAHRTARTLAAACEGARTPALQAIESRPFLTVAERDVALLAAVGRTNREIAEELFRSVRTVESQLQRVYSKLGLSSRAELTETFNPEGTSH